MKKLSLIVADLEASQTCTITRNRKTIVMVIPQVQVTDEEVEGTWTQYQPSITVDGLTWTSSETFPFLYPAIIHLLGQLSSMVEL